MKTDLDTYAEAILTKLLEERYFILKTTGKEPETLPITKQDFDILKSYNQFNRMLSTYQGEFNKVFGIPIRIVK